MIVQKSETVMGNYYVYWLSPGDGGAGAQQNGKV